MKKVLFAAAAIMMVCAFTSCKKVCTCTEESIGWEEKVETDSEYRSCQAIEDALNEAGAGLLDIKCK